MKICILGYKGMLGRYVYTYLKSKNFDVVGLSRENFNILDHKDKLTLERNLRGIIHPNDIIINCVGVIKPMVEKTGILNTIHINSVFPHLLSEVSSYNEFKLLHISTDCFHPSTKVLTNTQYVKIKDLQVNDYVYTHNGNIKKITDILCRYVSEKIYVIKTLSNDIIKCTENHPWYAIKRSFQKNVNFNESNWIKTKNLEKGNIILIPKIKLPEQTIEKINLLEFDTIYKKQIDEYNFFLDNIDDKKLNITKFCLNNNLNYKKIIDWKNNKKRQPKVWRLKSILDINKDVSWFFGLFLAEGWVNNNKQRKTITISLGDENELINKVISVIKNEFNINPHIRLHKNQKGTQITFTHQLLCEMLSKDFYSNNEHYSHTKKIPNWVKNIGEKNIISFIKGYVDGDGCFFENNKGNCFMSMSSTSEELIDELKILFMLLGILPNKYMGRKSGETKIGNRKVNIKNSFILTISGKQVEKIIKIFNIKSDFFNVVKRYNRFFENDKYWGVPIINIETENYEGLVYNLEIDDDHSYLVNGGLSAHNCVFACNDNIKNEESEHDCTDVYGKTKSLGEPENCTVIRTSIIGEEVNQGRSLIEWVKSKKNDTANGFINHYWNGLTCLQVAKIFEDIIVNNKFWQGVRHIFSPYPVSKYELVNYINQTYNLNINIIPTESKETCDRILTTKYQNDFNIPPIDTQIKELYQFSNILNNTI